MLVDGPKETESGRETGRMSDTDGAPGGPMISRPERSGNIGLLIGLAVLLVGAAAAFAVMDREVAQPFILALLGILAVIGVFCLLLIEARQTTALELPDHDSALVLKCQTDVTDVLPVDSSNSGSGNSNNNTLEIVIEASDADEMRCWLGALLTCMKWPMASATINSIKETR